MAYATVADVESRLGRDLTATEETQVTELLEDAEAILETRIPDLHERVSNGELSQRIVVMVEVNMVLRVLRNPDAFVSETDGNYSYTRSESGASGYLHVLPLEWDWLVRGTGMYQLVPVLPEAGGKEGYTQPNAHEIHPPSWGWVVSVP